MKRLGCYFGWALGAGLLGAVAVGLWLGGGVLFPPRPGSVEDVYASLRVGMRRGEAIMVLESCDPVETVNYHGTTKDGRRYSGGITWKWLPPPDQTADGVIDCFTNDGDDLYVYLGPDSIVTGKEMHWNHPFWERCVGRLRDALGR